MVLKQMMDAIRDTFKYEAREVEGTQTPGETLSTKSGTCRDFAWLMIETLRRLGIPCRFLTGYLYDSALDGGSVAMTGSASTHAWLSVYLPGAGWLQYDPTNRISEGFALIPVALARHPAQAIPLQGAWFGEASDYLGMNVAYLSTRSRTSSRLLEAPYDEPQRRNPLVSAQYRRCLVADRQSVFDRAHGGQHDRGAD